MVVVIYISGYLPYIYLNFSCTDPLFTSDDIKGWYTEDRSKGSASIEGRRNMHVHVSQGNHLGGQVDNKWQECYVQHLNAYWTIQ